VGTLRIEIKASASASESVQTGLVCHIAATIDDIDPQRLQNARY